MINAGPAGLIFCLLYSIDILILKKGGKPSISDCKKGKGHAMYDECPSYAGHPSLTSYHLMGKTHITHHMMGTHHKLPAN